MPNRLLSYRHGIYKSFGEMLKKEDFAWELKNFGFSDFERMVFARAAGWLWSSSVPFTVAYNAVRAFAFLFWDKEKQS